MFRFYIKIGIAMIITVAVSGLLSTSKHAKAHDAGSPNTTQQHYRWRNDTAGLNVNSGWHQLVDTAHTGLDRNTIIRLRVSLSNEGTAATGNLRFNLQYAPKVGGTCGDDETFVDVPSSSSVTTEHFQMDVSSQYSSGDAVTTNYLTSEASTQVNGEGVEDTTTQTSNLSMNADEELELEWAIEANSNSTYSGNYCFRFDPAEVDSYSSTYPELTLGAAPDTITVAADGTQTSSIYNDKDDQHIGTFTFISDAGTHAVTSINVSFSGTVVEDTDLTNVDIRYETSGTCTYDATESLFGTDTSVSSGDAVVTGSMDVSTSQICVYIIADIGSGAASGETIELEITDPSTEIVATGADITPGTAVAVTGTSTIANGTITVAASGTQTSEVGASTTNKLIGTYTFSRDHGTTTVSSIQVNFSGTVDEDTDLTNVDIRYEMATSCSFGGSETLMGTDTTVTSGAAVITGSMDVGNTQICVYVISDVGAGASPGETIELTISNPSTGVVPGSGVVSPGTDTPVSGTTSISLTGSAPPPTGIITSATQKTDGSGVVDITTSIDDSNADISRLNIGYTSGSCTPTSGTDGHNNPSANSSSGSGNAWSNGGNIYSSDNNDASSTVTSSDDTQYIHATNFSSFNLPANAQIDGIEVKAELSEGLGSGSCNLNARAEVVGCSSGEPAVRTTTTLTTTDVVYTLGGSTDTWGFDCTRAEVNGSSFGVKIQVYSTSCTGTRSPTVDHVTMKVWYTVPVSFSDATLQTPITATYSDTGGVPDINNANEYQVGSTLNTGIVTGQAFPNSVAFDWDSTTDVPTASGAANGYCLELTANDHAADQTTPDTQALTVDNTVPSPAPGTLVANSNTDTTVTLDFGAQSSDTNAPAADHYRLYYSTASPVTETDAAFDHADLDSYNYGGSSSITVTGLDPETTYYFKLWAYDKYCASSWSSCSGNKTPAAGEVSVTTSAAGAVDLSWDTSGADYDVWMSESPTWDEGTSVCTATLTDSEATTVGCNSGNATSTSMYRVQVVLKNAGGSTAAMSGSEYIDFKNIKSGWAGTEPTLGSCYFEDFDSDDASAVCNVAWSGNDVRITASSGTVNIAAASTQGFSYYITTDSQVPSTDSNSFMDASIDSDTEDSSKITHGGGFYWASGTFYSSGLDTASYPTIFNKNPTRLTWTQTLPTACTLEIYLRGNDTGTTMANFDSGTTIGPYSTTTATAGVQDLVGAGLAGLQYYQYQVNMTSCNDASQAPILHSINIDFD